MDAHEREELWQPIDTLAVRTHDAQVSYSGPRREAILALVDGYLEDAVTVLQGFVERAAESGTSVSARQFVLSHLYTRHSTSAVRRSGSAHSRHSTHSWARLHKLCYSRCKATWLKRKCWWGRGSTRCSTIAAATSRK